MNSRTEILSLMSLGVEIFGGMKAPPQVLEYFYQLPLAPYIENIGRSTETRVRESSSSLDSRSMKISIFMYLESVVTHAKTIDIRACLGVFSYCSQQSHQQCSC